MATHSHVRPAMSAGCHPPVRLTQRATRALTALRDERDSTVARGKLVVTRTGGAEADVRWWTWSVRKADATLAASLGSLAEGKAMESMIIKRASFVAPLVLLFGLTACSGEERGIAEPKVPSSSSAEESGPATTSSVEPASLSVDPCELLTADDLAEVGEFETEYKEGGGARSCQWQNSSSGNGDVFTFGLSVRDSQGIDTVNDIGNGLEHVEVNQRPAVSTQDPVSGDCTLALEIDASSRVDVTVLGEGDGLDDSCEIAEVIAGMMEPRLPDVA